MEMSGKIRVLDEIAINQIAAGEVVENAASVVKELVENAIDAGASEVAVTIKAGGRQLIRVADDGSGMSGDDALLCLERHATSKIRSAEDLSCVMSMGFRGEALSSIASVSKVKVVTAEEGRAATEVIVHGGKIVRSGPTSRSSGTTIEVTSLFYNAPVRQKFLKSIGAEVSQIRSVITSLALAHPKISFSLVSGEESLISLNRSISSLEERVAELLGTDDFKSIDYSEGELRVRGMLGLPSLARPTRKGQYLFINGRAVLSKALSNAVQEAYSTRLSAGRHPVFVLHLTVPPGLVDVNVHPQKREVRLREQERLFSLIGDAVRSAFARATNAPPVVGPLRINDRPMEFVASSMPILEEEHEPLLTPLSVSIVGLFDRYILVDGRTMPDEMEGLVVIDSRAAYARVVYEELSKSSKENDSQLLLVPITLELLPEEASLLEEHLEELSGIGFSLRPFGGNTFVVDALPAMIDSDDIEGMIHDISTYLKDKSGAIVAAAVAAASRRSLPSLDMSSHLVRQLLECEISDRCPRGKSIMRTISLEELWQ